MFNLLSLKTTNFKKKKKTFFYIFRYQFKGPYNNVSKHNTTKMWISLPTGPSDHATSCPDLRLFLQSHRFTVLYHTKSFEEELRAQIITQNLQVSFFLSFCK